MSYKRLGDYIQLVDNRNVDLAVTNLLGINITKNFMPSVANVSGTDLSKYKIIQKGQFAYSAMQVGRDETIRLALYAEDEPAIISPAYSVIESKDIEELLPEYMMMWFQRPESDRYGWFISDSSVRASLDYDRLSDIEIPIPHIDEQRKYVALYNGILANQKTYENSLEDLQLICDTYIEDLIKKEEPKILGDYIEQVNIRNEENKKYPVQGVSNSRGFIKTRAKTQSINFSNYKIVKPDFFAYNPARLNIGSIALRTDEDCVVSPMYVIFKIIDKKKLLPEFLTLWFKRKAFCNYAWFYAFGSVRDIFDYKLMEEVKLPIPSIEKQAAIVTIYNTLETRKHINEQLKAKIKPLCPVLMRGVVEGLETKNLKTEAV